MLLVVRHIDPVVDRPHRTSIDAGTAVDAGVWIDVKALSVAVKARHRAGGGAIREAATLAVGGDYVGHGQSGSRERCCRCEAAALARLSVSVQVEHLADDLPLAVELDEVEEVGEAVAGPVVGVHA